jgi:nicotinamide-nucleotide amidase
MDFGTELMHLMLGPPRLTLAVAESVTCGRVQARIGAISGASRFFIGGLTAYTLAQKVRHLGVDWAQAEAVDAVSPEIAAQMARGACAFFGSDVAVATTGYAEPAPERGVTQPVAFWALAHRGADNALVLRQGRFDCPRMARAEMQETVTDGLLAALVSHLREFRGAG